MTTINCFYLHIFHLIKLVFNPPNQIHLYQDGLLVFHGRKFLQGGLKIINTFKNERKNYRKLGHVRAI